MLSCFRAAFHPVTLGHHQTDASPTKDWKQSFLETTGQDPPDCWDMKLSNGSMSHKPAVTKAWRGAATLIPKAPKKRPAAFKHASAFTDYCNHNAFSMLSLGYTGQR